MEIVLPANSEHSRRKNFSYAVKAIMLYFTTVCLYVHVFIHTFSAHAHKPTPRNAAPSNCKTKHKEEALLSDRKQQANIF